MRKEMLYMINRKSKKLFLCAKKEATLAMPPGTLIPLGFKVSYLGFIFDLELHIVFYCG
jgi:hypothetical protein